MDAVEEIFILKNFFMKNNSCVVIDYGLGNTFSVINALKIIGAEPILTNDYKKIQNAERVVLPGVGAFGNGMEKLKKHNIIESLSDYISRERPLLGICLGMQLLMDVSYEFGKFNGLGYIKGEVKKINIKDNNSKLIKVPLIGWYKTIVNDLISSNTSKELLGESINKRSFYYVHSYAAFPTKKENLLAYVAHYNQRIAAAICEKNIIGVQFHPERSGEFGLGLIEKFMHL